MQWLQCNAMQCILQCNAMQCLMQWNGMQCNAMQCIMQCNAMCNGANVPWNVHKLTKVAQCSYDKAMQCDCKVKQCDMWKWYKALSFTTTTRTLCLAAVVVQTHAERPYDHVWPNKTHVPNLNMSKLIIVCWFVQRTQHKHINQTLSHKCKTLVSHRV